MSVSHSTRHRAEPATPPAPIATVRAYRKSGSAVVTIERPGRPKHRYCVSLRRYHALREWTAFGRHRWTSSGSWLRSSLTVYLWARS